MADALEIVRQRRAELEARLNEANNSRQQAIQYAQQLANEIVGMARAINELDEVVRIVEAQPAPVLKMQPAPMPAELPGEPTVEKTVLEEGVTNATCEAENR